MVKDIERYIKKSKVSEMIMIGVGKSRKKRRKGKSLGKRAILFAISLVILTLILLSLSTLFLRQRHGENFFSQGSIDRVISLDVSLQKSISDLVEAHSGLFVVNNEDNVVIRETLVQDFSTLKEKIGNFTGFVKNKVPAAGISANIQTMSFNLTPRGIVYTHACNECGQQTNAYNTIIVKRVNLASAFEIRLTFPQGEEGVCPITWNEDEEGSLRFNITAIDVLGRCSSQRFIDPSEENEITVAHSLGDIKIEIEDNEIEINRPSTTRPYTVETKIFMPPTEKIVSIKMPEIITNVSLPDFRIIGEARFLT